MKKIIDRWFREAVLPAEDGTYELIGPKVQGNPYGEKEHRLVSHGANVLEGVPRRYGMLREWFSLNTLEGVVWHHPDGRMVKIKRRDFGFRWP